MPARSESLRLVLVTDQSASARPLPVVVEAALRGGVTAVMLRERDMTTKGLYDLAVELRRITQRAGALLIVNDRVDVALAAGADGVHLGWQSLPFENARALMGESRLVGASTHSPDEARRAAQQGADYVTFGPVFPTPRKAGLVAVQGVEGVAAARRDLAVPLVGLGGIDPANAAQVLRAGADGVAAIRALVAAEDPEQAARAFARAWRPSP
ncbi:MAG TPA: thiamine phosphate synthase [Sumerlaeia bacterium]|nr:thiamine phosphate synthase [Sumerlaeia bacterium]